ncbi:MAG: hypothetical protein JWM41_463 [Gemmatimonadetes bacterium]|nr:hypothetical protein [Gemmatimonadota bacterium]
MVGGLQEPQRRFDQSAPLRELSLPRSSACAAAVLWLGTGLALGIITTPHSQESGGAVMGRASGGDLFLRIAANNLIAVAILLAGRWTAGVSAAAGLMVNGVKIARLTRLLHTSGVTAAGIMMMLGPHGIIEVPVLLIAGAFGLGGFQALTVAFGATRETGRPHRAAGRRTVYLLGAALVVAAAIEAWISQPLATHFLPPGR